MTQATGAPPRTVLVTGAGGFIGGHLVRALLDDGAVPLRAVNVRAVDKKPLDGWFQHDSRASVRVADLRDRAAAAAAVEGVDEVYNLACNMGGMGFIESHKADCMASVTINTNLAEAAARAGVERYFYASSACVYAQERQRDAEVTALVEADAYPADPEDGYGWEKLFSERMCRHAREEWGLETRVARFHNVYGPFGAFEGGREKAPAAICRKVASAVLEGHDSIEIWGDGQQTRSFLWIEDCLAGIRAIQRGDAAEPVNLGASELVSIDDLVSIIEGIAGVSLRRRYRLDAPRGVRGRNSDNTEFERRYGWAPATTLVDGLTATYRWIFERMVAARGTLRPAERMASRAARTQETA
ncbi:MAG: NAD-dependent epimerase/dehydratase family protein [Planctomycetota bacterium]